MQPTADQFYILVVDTCPVMEFEGVLQLLHTAENNVFNYRDEWMILADVELVMLCT